MQFLLAHVDLSGMLLDEAQPIAHVGSWELDVASNLMSLTAEHYVLFGLDPSDFAPTIDYLLTLVHEDDLARMRAILEASIANATPFSCVCRVRRPSNEIRWAEIVGVPSIIDGVVVSLIGTALDVTAKELSQAALRESEARY